jgi:hypothetical protein
MHTSGRLLLALALTACSESTETGPPVDENLAPEWSDAPTAAVTVGQGQAVTLPITVTDEAAAEVLVSAVAPDGVEAELVETEDGAELTVRVGYTLSGPVTLDVELKDGEQKTTTIPLTLEVVPIRWLAREEWEDPPGPPAREHGSVIVDIEGGQAFVFGGTGYSPYLEPFNDAWRYDLVTGEWTEVTPSGDVPAPGGSRRVAHVPGTKIAYLFGGYGGDEGADIFDDLYRVTVNGNGLEFELVPQNDTPPARFLHGFAYDPESERFITFGGAGTGLFDDTWTMTVDADGATWVELDLDDAPSGRYGFFSGMDVETGRFILFSGQVSQTGFADDTWSLDLRAEPPVWQLLSEGGGEGEPPGRRNGCGVFDPSGPRLFVFGGTSDGMNSQPGLFAFDARPEHAGWTALSLDGEPPVRSSGFGFHDATTGRTLLGFGNTTGAVFTDWGVIGY